MSDHRIIKVESTEYSVVISLENGKQIHLASNPNYLHVHFAGLGNKRIRVFDLAANQVNIRYNERELTHEELVARTW